MTEFYGENFIAVFLGDSKKSRKKAYCLYRDYDIKSIFFDDKISFITRFCPFIKGYSTIDYIYDDNLVCLICDYSLKEEKTPLLFTENIKFKGLVRRNEEYLSTHFIMDTDTFIKNL